MAVLSYQDARDRWTPLGIYYRHSGKVSLGGLAMVLIVGIPWSAAIGVAWGYCGARWFFLDLLFCIASGYFTSIGCAIVLRHAKIRHRLIASATLALMALTTWYVAWAIWAHLIVTKSATTPLPSMSINFLIHPVALGRVIRIVHEIGTWSLGVKLAGGPGLAPDEAWETITGTTLTLFWLGETALFWTTAGLIIYRQVEARAFCEGCGRWCDAPKRFACVPAVPPLSLQARIELHDFSSLCGWVSVSGSSHWVDFSRETCGMCTRVNLLTLEQAWTAQNARGQMIEHRTPLVKRLVLSPVEMKTVEEIIAQES